MEGYRAYLPLNFAFRILQKSSEHPLFLPLSHPCSPRAQCAPRSHILSLTRVHHRASRCSYSTSIGRRLMTATLLRFSRLSAPSAPETYFVNQV